MAALPRGIQCLTGYNATSRRAWTFLWPRRQASFRTPDEQGMIPASWPSDRCRRPLQGKTPSCLNPGIDANISGLRSYLFASKSPSSATIYARNKKLVDIADSQNPCWQGQPRHRRRYHRGRWDLFITTQVQFRQSTTRKNPSRCSTCLTMTSGLELSRKRPKYHLLT